jgi:hypothetical protein
MDKVNDSELLTHYDNVRRDMRMEVTQRVSQRDRFGIECFIAIGTLVIAATQFGWVLLAAPLIVIYYTTQIFESYKVHKKLVRYIADVVEENINALLTGTPANAPWEEWQKYSDRIKNFNTIVLGSDNSEDSSDKKGTRGARKKFFRNSMFAMVTLSCVGAFTLIHVQKTYLWMGPEIASAIILITTSIYYVWSWSIWRKYRD